MQYVKLTARNEEGKDVASKTVKLENLLEGNQSLIDLLKEEGISWNLISIKDATVEQTLDAME